MGKNDVSSQSGVAILISILLVGVMLSIVFALTAIFIPKVRSATETKNSIPAAYAAETGLEYCLRVSRKGSADIPVMLNGSTYQIQNNDCLNSPVFSVGTYHNVTRAFEISY